MTSGVLPETSACDQINHPTFFKLYQGWNEAKMIMQAKMFSAMGVWTSLEPQLTTPTTSPSLQGGGEPRVRGPV